MSVLDWDENHLEMTADEDFVAAAKEDLQSRNREVLHCVLSGPDCETCQ